MQRFALAPIPRIVAGPESSADLGALIREIEPEGLPLLVIDPGLPPEVRERIRDGLGPCLVFDAFTADPKLAEADAGAEIARERNARIVIAVGGGSALDVGKAIAALAPATQPAAHYALCANPLPPRPLRKICVPTTAGTGSETTRTAVLSDAGGAKVWLWGPELKADAVILDPTLSVTLPPSLTAATGIDALIHALEASTNRNAHPATSLFCHEAIGLVGYNLPKALARPGDLDARGGLLWAAALAGIGIDNAGTAIAHNIGHALASLRPVHHGRAVGLAMLATLPWNVARDDGRWAGAAAAMGIKGADALPAAFERLLREAGIKVSLRGEGHDDATPERLAAEMAAPANEPMRRSNFRVVADADLLAFAHRILEQA